MINKSKVLVVVPAFNEQDSVRAVLQRLKLNHFQSLLISDGSIDQTAEIGRSEGVHVLELPINLGVGGALRAGFKFAERKGFEAVVQIDADGQHPIEGIQNLIDAVNRTNAHMVIGSRFLNDESTLKVKGVRRIAMLILAKSASRAAQTAITDSTSGFRLIRQPLLGQFALNFANNYLGDTYEAVISAGRGKYKIVEIPAALMPREIGESTASAKSALIFTLKGLGVAILRMHKRLGVS